MKATGIDVGRHGFRVVTLEGTPRAARVAHAQEILPQGDGKDGGGGSLVDPGAAAALARRTLADDIVAGVSARGVFLREVSLPFIAPSQIPEVLPFEVEAFLPCPAEEIVLSWIPLGPAKKPGEGSGEGEEKGRDPVLAVAARKETIRESLAAFRAAGWEPGSLTADLFALPEAWPDLDDREPVLFIHVGEDEAAVVGWQAGRARFARLLAVGSGGAAAAPEASARQRAGRLAAEIRRALLAVEWDGRVREAALSGAAADLEFPKFLSEALGLPVCVWQGPEFQGKPLAAHYAVAYGLARRGLGSRRVDVELRVGEFRSRDLWERLSGALLALEGCAVTALLVVALGAWGRFSEARAEYQRIAQWKQQELSAVIPEAADLPSEEMIPFLKGKQAEFASGLVASAKEGQFISAWDIFLEFIRHMPDKMPLTRLEEVNLTQRELTVRIDTKDAGGKTGVDWAWEMHKLCNGSKFFLVEKSPEITELPQGGCHFVLRLAIREGAGRD